MGAYNPFPALNLRIRSTFSQKLSADAKNLLLSEIPAYENLQTSMYRLRRKFIPAAPTTQAEFGTSLDWFCVTSLPESQLLKEIFFTVMGYESFSSPQRIVFKSCNVPRLFLLMSLSV